MAKPCYSNTWAPTSPRFTNRQCRKSYTVRMLQGTKQPIRSSEQSHRLSRKWCSNFLTSKSAGQTRWPFCFNLHLRIKRQRTRCTTCTSNVHARKMTNPFSSGSDAIRRPRPNQSHMPTIVYWWVLNMSPCLTPSSFISISPWIIHIATFKISTIQMHQPCH